MIKKNSKIKNTFNKSYLILIFLALLITTQAGCSLLNNVLGISESQLTELKLANILDMAWNIVKWLMISAGGIAFIFVVISGIKYITSFGEKEAMEKAKKSLTWSIIGFIVMILSVAIIEFIFVTILGAPSNIIRK